MQVLRGLLESGADQNAQNTNGEVPLHVAAYTGVVPSVEALLSLGSAPDATDRYTQHTRRTRHDTRHELMTHTTRAGMARRRCTMRRGADTRGS